MNPHPAATLRKQLDRKIAPYWTLHPFRPSPGWISAIRRAIGLSPNMLAERMGVSRASVGRLEQREVSEEISLQALRQAAEAMDCTLLYALVPRQSLEERAQQRAAEVSDEMLASGSRGSRFASDVERDAARKRFIEDLVSGNPQRLWRSNARLAPKMS